MRLSTCLVLGPLLLGSPIAIAQQDGPSCGITPEALAVFRSGRKSDLAGVRSADFLAEKDVFAREIERHKRQVGRVLQYRLRKNRGEKNILIFLSTDGFLADFDIVED